MTKHTPGPWEAKDICVLVKGTSFEISQCFGSTFEVAMANAALIAAAPDTAAERDSLRALNAELLAVLEKAYHELNAIRARDGAPYTSQGHQEVSEEYFGQVVLEVRAAIAKAKGGGP